MEIKNIDEKSALPIAVIDSGVGGISVLRELVAVMPNENYIYFGDSKNAPYGTRSKQEVLDITRKNLDLLLSVGIKALVIACNTATSVAVSVLRRENPDLIIVGIEPAIKPPTSELDNPTVLVMATPLTLKEEKFLSLVKEYSHGANIIPLPCPGLVEFIERGELEGDALDQYLKKLFSPFDDTKIDALVLGCTHYPHVKEAITKHLPQSVRIFDGGRGTAMQTRRRLEENGLLNPSERQGEIGFINSASDEHFIELSRKLLYR